MGKCGAAETSLIYSKQTDKKPSHDHECICFQQCGSETKTLQRLLKLALVPGSLLLIFGGVIATQVDILIKLIFVLVDGCHLYLPLLPVSWLFMLGLSKVAEPVLEF